MATSFHRSYRMGGREKDGIVKIQLAAWREQMLSRFLPWTTLIATVAIVIGALSVAERRNWFYLPLYVAVYVVLVVLTLAKRIIYRAKARLLILLIAALGISVLAETGLGGVGRPFLLVLPIAAVVLLDWRFGLSGLALGTGALLVYGFSQNQVLDSILAATINAMLATGVIIAVHTIVENLSAAVAQELQSGERERTIQDHLERKAGQLKTELERRSNHLAIAVQFTGLVGDATDPADLLDQAATLLVERCGLVGATVYLLEDGGRTAVLRAAAGDAAGRLLEESRVVKVGERSLLGWCLQSGESQIRQDSDYLYHPTVPESRSALAVAIRARGHVLGAVELHAASPGAFDEQMVAMLQSTASLLGLALDNLNRADAGEFSLGGTSTLGRAAGRHLWSGGTRDGGPLFAEYHAPDVPPWSPGEVAHLIGQEEVLAIPFEADGDLRGRLVVEVPAGEAPPELDAVVLERIARQVGVAIESAQLFENTHRRAIYGQLMTEMSARVRSSLDPDTILKTAVRELGRALGARLTTVEVNTPGTSGRSTGRPAAAESREIA